MALNTSKTAIAGDWRRPAYGAGIVLLLTFGVFGGWSVFARLDSAVVASGHVAVQGERKVVQHLEGGRLAEILVSSDSVVKAGDVLFRIDPLEAEAGAGILRSQQQSLLAEEARLRAEIAKADTVTFPDGLPENVRNDQLAMFEDGLAARTNEIFVLERQLAQVETQIAGFRDQLASNDAQVASVQSEFDRIRPLLDQQLVPANRGLELERSILDLQTRSDSIASEIRRLDDVMAETNGKIDQVSRLAVQTASTRLGAVGSTLTEIGERLSVADVTVSRSEVRAPVSGRVVALAVHTVGQSVAPGSTLLEIVPEDGVLMVSARMSPLDVTHVHPGLSAEIRLPSFKRGETPMTFGEVTTVSADAMVDEATRQSYYELKVSMDGAAFPADVREALVAGMPAEVVISTGERSVLAYLTQPLTDAMRTGMRER